MPVPQPAHSLQGPLHILDCGAGDSEPIAKAIASSPDLKARVHSYTGVDLTPNAIAIGQRNMAAAVGAHCSVQCVDADMLHYVRWVLLGQGAGAQSRPTM